MRFVLNKPFETDQPEVEVDAGLPAGQYRFQLVVVNTHGQRSDPCEIVIIILPPSRETAPTPARGSIRPSCKNRHPT